MNLKKKTKRNKKKIKKNISVGIAHITSNFNNTIINITDLFGNTIAKISSGYVGFINHSKSTPYAAQQVAKKVSSLAKEHGIKQLEIFIKGFGSGRDTSIRGLQESGLEITAIKDVTPVPHNGCRPPKRPRS
ncbi:30S ribosomal protein S11 [Candidatus Phytoplasma oryzae]|nr:30S ribosomal protein S11 [Candidatus Phytoplasma oryzae]